MNKIRLFVRQENLNINYQFKIEGDDFNYLAKVMRQKDGDEILVFNNQNGEFVARLVEKFKNHFLCQIIRQTKEYKAANNITLAFAPVKNVRIDFIAAKATELGCKKFQPIITKHSIVDKVNYDRFNANLKEAAEQCGRNDLPEILPIEKLNKFLSKNSSDKILILCDESGSAKRAKEILPTIQSDNKEIVILIGPEGGFAKEEFEAMYRIDNLYPISLGSLILRSDTAIISSLTLVREFLF